MELERPDELKPMKRRVGAPAARRMGYAVLLVAAGLATVLAFLPGVTARLTAERRARLLAELRAELNAQRVTLAGLDREFGSELDRALTPYFETARRGSGQAVRNLSGFRVCARLCYKLAADRLRGTAAAPEAIRAEIDAEVIAPCVAAQQKAVELLADHLRRIREADFACRSRLAARLSREPSPGLQYEALRAFGEDMFHAEQATVDLAVGRMSAALGATLEALFVRTTMGVVERVAARAVARISGTLSAGAIAAAADGPLPAGDAVGAVIAVGGLSWTAYDIVQAQQVLPGQLYGKLLEAVDSCETGMKRETFEQGRQLTRQSELALAALEASLAARVGGKP